MKMAAGRRGWKPRQALSQASTRSRWRARARHRGKASYPGISNFRLRETVGVFTFALRFDGQSGELFAEVMDRPCRQVDSEAHRDRTCVSNVAVHTRRALTCQRQY